MKVLIAGGGTGGHYFPALSVAYELKRRGHEVIYVGSKRGIEGKLGFPASYSLLLSHSSVRGRGLSSLFSLFGHLKAFKESFLFIRKLKPRVAVVFGGYSSLPAGLACVALRVGLFIQEQNSVPGKVNRILSRFATSAFLGFPAASDFLHCPSIFTGNPLRKEIKEARKIKRKEVLRKLKLSEEKRTLLVLGGSQGALFINEALKSVARELPKGIQVVHITGKGKDKGLKEAYQRAGIEARIFSFYEKIWELYLIADGAISRSGALAISELSAFKVPTLFIPYPYAADDHQYKNALYLAKRGGALLYRQEEITKEKLLGGIKTVLFDIMARERMKKVLENAFPTNADEEIVNEIERWSRKRG